MDSKLRQNPLGKTGLQVTEFCLGMLPMGPLYANLSLVECVGLIHEAMDLEVNFFDTTEVYRTQPYLGRALAGRRGEAGKGLYAMKALAGGNLIARHREAINWAREIPSISSLAIGVISGDELRQDLSVFGLKTGMEGVEVTIKDKRLFVFEKICKGCGECVQACHNDALFLQDDIPRVDHDKCRLCGYCSAACPMFAIRVL